MSITRRMMLQSASCGFGYLALQALASAETKTSKDYRPQLHSLAPQVPVIKARAKRVDFFMYERWARAYGYIRL